MHVIEKLDVTPNSLTIPFYIFFLPLDTPC